MSFEELCDTHQPYKSLLVVCGYQEQMKKKCASFNLSVVFSQSALSGSV